MCLVLVEPYLRRSTCGPKRSLLDAKERAELTIRWFHDFVYCSDYSSQRTEFFHWKHAHNLHVLNRRFLAGLTKGVRFQVGIISCQTSY